MSFDEVDVPQHKEYSPELLTILEKILIAIDENGVSSDPNDASAYYLLDRLTKSDDLVREFVENWQECESEGYPNGGNSRLYYLAKLHEKYTEKPIRVVVRENGILDQFRAAQMRDGYLRIDDGQFHGFGFRGLIAIAPESDIARKAIDNIIFRYESDGDIGCLQPPIMPETALGLLEHNYDRYKPVIEDVCKQAKLRVDKVLDPQTTFDYISPATILLLEKTPSVRISQMDAAVSAMYKKLIEEEDSNLGFSSEVGIALLAADHGPSTSAYHADWDAELRVQQQYQQLPEFVSTQPATAVENRETSIKRRMERMIDQTEESLYISTRRVGMLHHELLDLLEAESELDFRLLTNRKKASGERKKFKRAAMNELVKRSGIRPRSCRGPQRDGTDGTPVEQPEPCRSGMGDVPQNVGIQV